MDRRDLQETISASVRIALEEDVGIGDLTANLIPEQTRARATVVSREDAVICGCDWFDEVFAQLSDDVVVAWHVDDGESVESGQALCELSGSARSILSGERAALNFLQTLSATATVSAEFAAAIQDTQAVVLDTRKTLPGLRLAQKYAAQCGGCTNHRIGLFDGILIKENHIMAANSIADAVNAARSLRSDVPIQVEVEGLDELQQALAANADMALLDNFTLEQMREAVALTDGRIALEASGDVTIDRVKEIAHTGVDRISVGALTKNVKAIDLSMRFQVEN